MKFYRLSGATFYDCINTIYQFIKPFLDDKMSIFEEYGAFKLEWLVLSSCTFTETCRSCLGQSEENFLSGFITNCNSLKYNPVSSVLLSFFNSLSNGQRSRIRYIFCFFCYFFLILTKGVKWYEELLLLAKLRWLNKHPSEIILTWKY